MNATHIFRDAEHTDNALNGLPCVVETTRRNPMMGYDRIARFTDKPDAIATHVGWVLDDVLDYLVLDDFEGVVVECNASDLLPIETKESA